MSLPEDEAGPGGPSLIEAADAADAETHLCNVLGGMMMPRERVGLSDWIEQNRMLDANFASEPGPFKLTRTPYMVEIYNCLLDPGVSRITLVKSARVGGSEMLNNFALFTMDRAPGPSMYVLPTEEDAKQEATGRLRFMIEDCPAVEQYVPYPGWATGHQLNLSGPRTMYMAWAQAPRTMIRKTCKYVWFDELDNLEKAAGSLGNHLAVAAERTTTYGRMGKVASATTPTHPDAAAWREWLGSDKRTYHVPCPHCGQYQVFVLSGIKWPEDSTADEIEADELAWYECLGCNGRIEERQRWWMVLRGLWLTAGQTAAERLPVDDPLIVRRAASLAANRWQPQVDGEPVRTRRRGYHIWSAYSPWRGFSMIAAEFLRSKNDPDLFRVFVNSWLGEPWTDVVVDVNPQALRSKRDGAHDKDVAPDDVKIIVVGIDTQTDHFVYEVRGWGSRRRSWLIREGIAETFAELEEVCVMQFEFATRSGTISPRLAAIDTGGDRTEQVYGWARQFGGVYPVKGAGLEQGHEPIWTVRPSKVDYTPTGKRVPWSLILYHINTVYYKDMLMRLMARKADESGYWGVHAQTSEDYFKQVTAEHKIWVTKGRKEAQRRQQVWALKSTSRKNHFLDAAVYGMAIADHRGVFALSDGSLRKAKKRAGSSRDVSKTSIRNRKQITRR